MHVARARARDSEQAGEEMGGWVGESATLETDTGWLKGGERRSASDRQSKKRVGMVRREQEEGRTSQRQDRKRLWSVESQLGAGEAVLPRLWANQHIKRALFHKARKIITRGKAGARHQQGLGD